MLESAGISDEEARAVLGGGDTSAIRQYLEVDAAETEEPPVLVMVMS